MKRKLTTREKVLVIGLAVAAVVLYRGWRSDGLGLANSAGKDEAEARRLGSAPVVRMDLLAQVAGDFEPGRDLFQYYVPPPKKKKVVKPKPRPKKKKVDRPKPPPPPPAAPARPRAPQPNFAYLGYLGPKDGRIAVFDGGGDLMLARIGDVVEDQFKLMEFKYDKVVIGFTDERFQNDTTELEMKPR